MSRYLSALLTAWLAFIGASPTGADAAEAVRPNIVFIITDDQRYDQLGCMGHPVLKTPQIDRIAREGMLFRNSFTVLPLCSPSRASVLTGVYPHQHRIINNDKLGHDAVSHTLMTFPRRLREAGYETAFVGKWHMGHDDSRRVGFDRWYSFKGQGAYIDGLVNDDGVQRQLTGYMTDFINREAAAWVERPRTKPFCLIVSHKAVHAPYLPAPRHENLYSDYEFRPDPVPAGDLEGKPVLTRKVRPHDRFLLEDIAPEPAEPRRSRGTNTASVVRDQMRCLASVDEGVGQLFAALEKTKQLDQTILVYTGDNGYLMGEHGRFDDKRWAYEESIRVPLLIRYPPLVRAGSECLRQVLNIDLAPTFLEMACVEPVAPMHGLSLVPLLGNPAGPGRSSILVEYFLEKVGPQTPTWQAVRTERFKYIRYADDPAWDELYDLQNDPHELKNLVGDSSEAAMLSSMRSELDRLLKQTKFPPASLPKR